MQMMDSLFTSVAPKPLADRLRPKSLADFVGQEKVIGKNSYLRRMIENDSIPSIIFYGPPGTGKTTLAKVIAEMTGSIFESINAVSSGVPELRKLLASAVERQRAGIGRTIIFIDEIHRFNKAQQDVLLPYVENGTIVLIGATTENPFFEINSPLLSRMKVIRLEQLCEDEIKKVIKRALADSVNGYGAVGINITDEAIDVVANFANGDARRALNVLEQAIAMLAENSKELDINVLRLVLGNVVLQYDKNGDYHYDIISAFIKSMRGSDVNASIHYLARMLAAGENIEYIARRIIICAAEDVGLADPQALTVATSCFQAIKILGMPEARIPLAQAVAYIALAPKSNACYLAIDKALQDLNTIDCGDVPAHLKDAHYAGAQNLGWGLDYKYPHDYPNNYVSQQYLPDNLKGKIYLATNNLTPKEI